MRDKAIVTARPFIKDLFEQVPSLQVKEQRSASPIMTRRMTLFAEPQPRLQKTWTQENLGGEGALNVSIELE